MEGIEKVNKNIKEIYARRKAAVFAICLETSARALQWFRNWQRKNEFWNNQTKQALNRVFTRAYISETDIENYVAWFIAHGVDYGIYLELANDRQNESLRKTISVFIDQFLRDVKSLYVE